MLSSGSSPLPDVVTRSTGTGSALPGSASRSALTRSRTASASAGLRGPRFDPDDDAALYGCGEVADGRLQKYFGWSNGRPERTEARGSAPAAITGAPGRARKT